MKMHCEHRAGVRAFRTQGVGWQGENDDIIGGVDGESSGHHSRGSNIGQERDKRSFGQSKRFTKQQREF